MVKRILNKHGYPPDLQDEPVRTVLKQAELLCADWSLGSSPQGIFILPVYLSAPNNAHAGTARTLRERDKYSSLR